jgi:hypothetical protein
MASFKEYSKEEFEEKKKQVFEKQEQMFLESVYHLFQKFDLAIGKGNDSEISNYIIILSSLFTLIENNHWINLYETLNKKLKNNITYRTFKSKRGAMTELIGKKSDFQLNKTWKGANLKGGSGFLIMAIVGIAVASSLIQSISATAGFTVDALYEKNIAKNFVSRHPTEKQLSACQQFRYSMSNTGGSCTINSMLASSNSSGHSDVLDYMEYEHRPNAQASSIVTRLNYINKPYIHRNQFYGREHGTPIHNLYSWSNKNKIYRSTGKENLVDDSIEGIDSCFNNWEELKDHMAEMGGFVHSNWESSVNSKSGDIAISTFVIKTFHDGHASNMITRNVNGTVKVGAIDSNRYSSLLRIEKDANNNYACVPGSGYTTGFIYAEDGFFTPEELIELKGAVVQSDKPIEDFFRSMPHFDSNMHPCDIQVSFDVFSQNNFETSSQFPLMEFGVTDMSRFIDLKYDIIGLTDDFFEILKQTPNAVPFDIDWDETLGKYTYYMPGGKTKRFKINLLVWDHKGTTSSLKRNKKSKRKTKSKRNKK